MQKLFFLAITFALFTTALAAQKVITKDAKVSFDATSSLEKIKAENKSGSVALNTTTGDVVSRVMIKNFIFKQSLMQEHFNENYLESTKYPSATLSGKITNLSEVNFTKDGTYNAKIKGTMDMHGVKKDIEVPATITVKSGAISFDSKFSVTCADYKIDIPSLVSDKVAKVVNIAILGTFPKS